MGAFLLGAAGLLRGRRAATHWAYVDLLPLVGASHEKGRVVRAGHVFTTGGVTSGIDFAFRIIAEVAGPEVAQAIQLGIEYDPSPPFDAGHPDKASEAAIALMVHRNATAHTGIRQRSRIWRSWHGPADPSVASSRTTLNNVTSSCCAHRRELRYQVTLVGWIGRRDGQAGSRDPVLWRIANASRTIRNHMRSEFATE